jgi:hypothetical protein
VDQRVCAERTHPDFDRTGHLVGQSLAVPQRVAHRGREPALVIRHGLEARIDCVERAPDGLAHGRLGRRSWPQPAAEAG